MKRQKWIVGVAIGLLALSLVACGKNQNVSNTTDSTQGETEQIQVEPGVETYPSKITYYYSPSSIKYVEEFEYDSNNNIVKYKSADGYGNVISEYKWEETKENVVRKIDFYEGLVLDWIEETYDEGNLILSVKYDGDGSVSSRTEYKSGTDCARMMMCQSYIHGYSYDELYSNEVHYDKEGNVYSGFVGTFDDKGELIESTCYDGGNLILKTVYLYDSEGRLEYHIDFFSMDEYEQYMETKDAQTYGRLYCHEYETYGSEMKEKTYRDSWPDEYTEWIYDESMNVRSYKEVDGEEVEYGWELNDKGKLIKRYTNAFIGDTTDREEVEATYEYEYYENGDLKIERCYFSGVLKEYSEYYENGIVKEYKQFYYWGASEEKEQKIRMHMTYNENGDETYYYSEVFGITDYSCEYNEKGLLAKKVKKIHNDDSIEEREWTWEYEYDDKGVVTKMSIYYGTDLQELYE